MKTSRNWWLWKGGSERKKENQEGKRIQDYWSR